MLTKNNPTDRRLVNGTMGSIVAFVQNDENSDKKTILQISVKFDGFPEPTEINREIFYHNTYQGKGHIIKQFPLDMAFATTIHKNQSLTIETGMVNLKKLFTPGQGYVACSRIKTLKGLHIIDMDDNSFTSNKIGIDEYIRLKKKEGHSTDDLEGYVKEKQETTGYTIPTKVYPTHTSVIKI
jgi:ATP-dependent exoDNAse (exonuclease V) alpha subunit